MSGQQDGKADIQGLDYHPATPYELDLEILSVSVLRHRVGSNELQSVHRYAFYQLVCVTQGLCTHMVDFTPIRCGQGSFVAIRPGQLHKFGPEEDWDGWMVLFRPEFLLSSPTAVPDMQLVTRLENLQEHTSLSEPHLQIVTKAISQMRIDGELEASAADINALLRYQLYALLLRLSISHDPHEAQSGSGPRPLQRFRRFQQLVESKFTEWHQVAAYARELGCSEKSLTRATLQVTGSHAKALIASRISLEAKRLLAHTALSVTSIGESLGFDETTNYIKFFKREAGCTPTEFRRRQQSG